jgi:hypothetical protein
MLRERLNKELKKSMLAKEQCATATLRLILAALKDRDIAGRSKGQSDGIGEAEILSMLRSSSAVKASRCTPRAAGKNLPNGKARKSRSSNVSCPRK